MIIISTVQISRGQVCNMNSTTVTAKDVVEAYNHLTEEEQAKFWLIMDKKRNQFMSSSKRELLKGLPVVPTEVAERMKEVIPFVEFKGDVRSAVCISWFFPLTTRPST